MSEPNSESPKTDLLASVSMPAILRALEFAKAVPLITFFGGLILYVFGFIIWNAHLSKFGLFASNLNTLDYFSAALSYLVYCTAIGSPVWFICHKWLYHKQPLEKIFLAETWPLLLLWYWLLNGISSFYFSDSIDYTAHWQIVASLFLIHLGCFTILRPRYPKSATIAILSSTLTYWFYLIIQQLVSFASLQSVSVLFMCSVLIQYALIFGVFGIANKHHGFFTVRFASRESKMVYGMVVCISILGNATLYGKLQFERVLRIAGGGHLVPVSINFNPNVILPPENSRRTSPPTDFHPCRLVVETGSSYYILRESNKQSKEQAWLVDKSKVTLISVSSERSLFDEPQK